MSEDRLDEDRKAREEMAETEEEKVQAQTDAVIDMLTERGILPEMRIDDEKVRQLRQERRKAAYHNTLMLLQHYRTIVWLLECFPETIAEELEKPFEGVDALIGQLDMEMSWGNKKLENRLEGMQKSRLLIDRVNEALTVLKKKPENGEKLYKLVYMTYIAPEPLSHTELLYRLDISSRTYYRLRQQAVTILSIRLWSAPAAEVDMWLEMVALFEGLQE